MHGPGRTCAPSGGWLRGPRRGLRLGEYREAVPTPGHFCPNGRALLSHPRRCHFGRALWVSHEVGAPPWRLFRRSPPPWRVFRPFKGFTVPPWCAETDIAPPWRVTPGLAHLPLRLLLTLCGQAMPERALAWVLGASGQETHARRPFGMGFGHQMPANPCHRDLWHGRATLVRRSRQSMGTVLPDDPSTVGARGSDGASPLLLAGGTRGAPTLMGGSGRPMARLTDAVTCGACGPTA